MNKDLHKQAVDLFQKRFNKLPADCGHPVIDIYEKQTAFLYAKTQEDADAYKKNQNIIRWVMKFYILPMVVIGILALFSLARYQDVSHPLFLASLVFLICWLFLFIVLWNISTQAENKCKGNVIWLNYPH